MLGWPSKPLMYCHFEPHARNLLPQAFINTVKIAVIDMPDMDKRHCPTMNTLANFS